jgi:ribosomal protein L32
MVPHRVCRSCGQYKGKAVVLKKDDAGKASE